MPIFGPDIASYQGTPDMGAVRGGVNDFVIIKVTEGVALRRGTKMSAGRKMMVGRPADPQRAKRVRPSVVIDGRRMWLPVRYVNPTWRTNRDNAHAAGLIVFLYHFARGGDPIAEARYFVNSIGGLRDGEGVILDWEVPGDAAAWSKMFLDEVFRLTGVRAWVYLNQFYVNSFNWQAVKDAGFPLWLALYDGDPWTFQPMPFWGAPLLKQYTDAAQIPGIAGNVDRNSFNGTREDLLAFALGGDDMANAQDVIDFLQNITGADLRLINSKVTETRDRVMGILQQRYYVKNADGTLTPADKDTKGAIPAGVLDTLDGNYLVSLIAGLSGAGQPAPEIDYAKLAAELIRQLGGKAKAAQALQG